MLSGATGVKAACKYVGEIDPRNLELIHVSSGNLLWETKTSDGNIFQELQKNLIIQCYLSAT